MSKFVLFFLVFMTFSISVRSQQQYFFYNHSDKISLKRDYDYILLKFNKIVSAPEQERIVYEAFGNFVKKKHIMRENYNNGEYSINVIIELKDNTDISAMENELLNFEEVKYVGMSFQNRDNVVHFTNGEIVVKFKDYVSTFDINNINNLFHCNIIYKLDLSPVEKNVYLLTVNSRGGNASEGVFEIANKYSFTPFVDYAQPNFIRTGMLLDPNDSLLPWMWHIRNIGSNIPDSNIHGTPGCDANVDSAWNITSGNTKILLAVIDTGVDTNHPDLKLNLCDRQFWYDAYEEDYQPYDEYSHGTGVSGIAGAIGNNHIGTVGVSYSCKLMPVRVFGPYPEAYTTDLILAKGLNWAWTHGAEVMNNSWGGGIPTPLISNAITNAFRFGRNGKGVVIFAGAGNSNVDTILYPSSMPEVISVGGLSPCNQRKSPQSCDNYNNLNGWGACYGEGLSIVAPTTYIGTTHLLGGWGFDGNGTSAASPIAAGVGALILAKNINLSADSVRVVIERGAVKVGNYSYNVPKQNGLWNYEMGYGRIDAKRALDITPPGPSQIFDQSPPIINVIPPESGILKSDIDIIARITDNEMVASGPNLPRLYFTTSVNPNVRITNGIPGKNNNYSFIIPALDSGARMYYYIAAQDTSSNGNVTTYPIGGSGVNPPGTGAPPRRLFLQNTDYYTNTFYSSDIPKYITESRETTVVSILNNPISKTILDVNCLININHSSDVDISVSLISPAGTEIILTGGTGGTGANYTNTQFDDEAKVSITDTNYHPPYTGTFKPIEKLWLLDGENSAGQWKLKVVDNAPGYGGVLNTWRIDVRYSTINENVSVPDRFALVKNFPNPFNPGTRIVFNVPYLAKVKIVIYDILGRQIKKLLDELRAPQFNDFVDFNTHDVSLNEGRGLPSGVYFYSLFADGNFVESKKMVLLK